MTVPSKSLETMCIHAGQGPDPQSGAVMPPIILASTFAQDEPGVHRGYDYGRSNNPTRHTLEACLAALEGASFGVAFGSGCAAMSALMLTLKSGDHVLCCDDLYGGTFRLFDKVMKPFGLESSFVDPSDPQAFAAALRPNTKMVWLETPSNPMLRVFDIAAIADVARVAGVPLIVDNTFATPLLQRPLELGAAAVVHSTTKYLNGHSDVVGGAVVTSDAALAERLRFVQKAVGGVPSPLDCYLVLRGLKTLAVRMRRHVESAGALAAWLVGRPGVAAVHYPALPGHPGRELAARQMRGAGGMISIELSGGAPAARAFLGSLKIFSCAISLGGVESLAGHPASMTHVSIPEESRKRAGITDGLVRLSIGLEAVDDLREDIAAGLAAATGR